MKRLLAAALIIVGSLAASVSTATAVTLNGLEWRQLTETTALSWSQVSAVCQGVDNACSGSVTRTIDGAVISFDGWTLATIDEVGDMFAAYTDHPGGIFEHTSTIDYASTTPLGGLTATNGDFRWGLTATLSGAPYGAYFGYGLNGCSGTCVAGQSVVNTSGLFSVSLKHEGVGFWLYSTPTPVPLPPGAWLMLSALGGLGFAGWRRRRAAE